jgi:hypothetical protein
MRRFILNRIKDQTGISCTGIVAEGIEFSTDRCAVSWLTEVSSVAIYDNIEDVERIHGHNGDTEIIFIPLADIDSVGAVKFNCITCEKEVPVSKVWCSDCVAKGEHNEAQEEETKKR